MTFVTNLFAFKRLVFKNESYAVWPNRFFTSKRKTFFEIDIYDSCQRFNSTVDALEFRSLD